MSDRLSSASHWFRVTIGSLLILIPGIAIGFVPQQLWEVRKPSEPQIFVSIQVVDVDRDSLPTLGIDPASWVRGAVAARSADNSIQTRVVSLRQTNRAKRLVDIRVAAANGRPASFHSGGELCIPVVSNGEITNVDLKEFGTRVDLLPTLLKDGRTRLSVSPQISRIDNTLSVNVAGTSVPGFHVRRSEEMEIDVANGETVDFVAFPPQPDAETPVTLIVASVEKLEAL